MSVKSIQKTPEIIDRYGSAFLAVNCIARKARKLKEDCYGVIQDSEAVEWAMSGDPPAKLDMTLKRRIEREEGMSEDDRLNSILDSIEESNIRKAVLNSFKLSKQRHQLMFDYNGIKDRGIRTRIRILTKMIYIPDRTIK